MSSAIASPALADSLAAPKPSWLKVAPVFFLLFWSSGFVALKAGLPYADPLTFLALRYVGVIGVLLILFAWLRPAMPRTRSAWFHLVAVGLILQGMFYSSTYLSLSHGMSAGGVALISSLQPILVGLLAPLVSREQVGARHWAGLVLGVMGAGLVIVAKSSVDMATGLGLGFAISSLLSLTAGTLWEKRFSPRVHPVSANLVQFTVALFVLVLPLAWYMEPMRVEWNFTMLFSLSYLVIFNSLIALSLLLAMLRFGEASRVSALFFLVPPGTAVVAFLVLGESIPLLAWPGMALAAAGIGLVTRKR
jgi:drug/metabolite transporter (DMT)-like permease